MITPDAFVTAAEAAARLGLSDARIRQMLLAGRLRGQKAGKHTWIIATSELERFERERKPRKPYCRRPPS